MLALIRAERVPEHLVDALGRFFMDRALPVLIKLLPATIAALELAKPQRIAALPGPSR